MHNRRVYRILLLLYFTLSILRGSAQQYYIGVPNYDEYVPDSARIVLNPLPWNYDGRLLAEAMPRYLEPLKKFLYEHPWHKCNFLLYSGFSDSEHNMGFTQYQGMNLSYYFTSQDTAFGRKYFNEVVQHPLPNPLFINLQPDSSEKLYQRQIMLSYKSCVIVELIRQKDISKMVQFSVFYAAPSDDSDFDIAPKFPGEIEGLYDFLFQKMDYSVVGQANVSGVVLVEFNIEPDGSITSPEIKKRLFPALDEQALKIVSEMPNWQPALKSGRPIRCRYRLPLYYFFM